MCRLSCFDAVPPCPAHSQALAQPALQRRAAPLTPESPMSAEPWAWPVALTRVQAPAMLLARRARPTRLSIEALHRRLDVASARVWCAAARVPLERIGEVTWSQLFDLAATHVFGAAAALPMRLAPLLTALTEAGLVTVAKPVFAALSAPQRQRLMQGEMSPQELLRTYARALRHWRADRAPVSARRLHKRLHAEGNGMMFWQALRWMEPARVVQLCAGALSPAAFFALYERGAQQHPDVLVVGAGAAGLAAASQLRNAGVRVTVLEARNRVGGRTHTVLNGFASRLDLGAARIHSASVNPLMGLAVGLGFTLRPDAPHGLAFTRLRAGDPQAHWHDLEEARVALSLAIAEVGLSSEDRPVSEVPWPEVGPWGPTALASLIPLQAGADPDVASVEDYFRIMPEAHEDYYVAEGLGELVASLGTGLPVHLSTRVESIHWSTPRATVTAGGVPYTASQVLVTVAVGEMPGLQFAPPLPAWKTNAYAQVPMGHYEKVIMEFSHNIFGDLAPGTPMQVECGIDEPLDFCLMPPLHSTGEAPGHVIAVAYAGGRFAQRLLSMGQRRARKYVLGRLRIAFGPEVDRAFVKSAHTAWETWSNGAYSAAKPHGYDARRLLRWPLENRLFFAGEACDRELLNGATWCTHLAGAYRSGLDAASAIAEVRNQEARHHASQAAASGTLPSAAQVV